ncbi:mitogen-activated protein kinase kinase kinase 7 [Fopius arisanus]|uniref:Mitogen-activated protein kinase kinase kinase 7 n=1 Tax=Fopius arisanus TaxID=64838 RepID=A0A0C9PNY1_9HYME|nr:PREDICTED: mitogen-activated protein kinase kinase kinase 7-like [Fopius arisanus]
MSESSENIIGEYEEGAIDEEGHQMQLTDDISHSGMSKLLREQNQLLMRQKSQQFVEEIDFREIQTEEFVGKGSFGVVYKAKWRGRYVAIKHINTEGERRAFTVEVRQLSRVSHPNIVRLYGACTTDPVCLVMEYAEGGSLYNVLHCEPKPHYTAGHAISWALQCARGVQYLHSMKPKPLIHRDLKPPNLLLILGGRTLKICDFGTACDLNTYMTNNKGSAAWMAPEVFEGSKYTEKCDIFSWGVILWEVLTRRKPFDDIGGSAYRIMWAVHVGQRPPLIEGCPKPIEDLITRCWQKNPEGRPGMEDIVTVMTHLSEFFSGELEPVEYIRSASEDFEEMDNEDDTIDMTWNESSQVDRTPRDDNQETLAGKSNNELGKRENPEFVEEIDNATPRMTRPPGAPVRSGGIASMEGQGHQPLHIDCDPGAWELQSSTDASWELQNMAGLDKMGLKVKKNSEQIPESSTSADDLDDVYRVLDADLRPLTPDNSCPISKEIFEEHKLLAQEYLKIQTEIALVGQYRSDMLKSLSPDALKDQQELSKLEDEKESLVKLYRNLKRQLELMKGQGVTSTPSVNSAVPGNNGWVFIPRQEPSRIS